MNGSYVEELDLIKTSIASMLLERSDMECASPYMPSEFWRNTLQFMDYIRCLPPEQLLNIRAHIGMGFFLGNPWDRDFYDGYNITTDAAAEKSPIIEKYNRYVEDLPECLHCSEPATNPLISQIGIRYRGKIINRDIVKEQGCISNLYHLGLLDALSTDDHVVLELGPGYGQLAHQLLNGASGRGCYICVDYPETLFWSSVFLAVNSKPGSVYIYDPSEGFQGWSRILASYRYVMIPNYLADTLRGLPRIDLFINQNSFQEMTEIQVRYYCELLSSTMTGWLYSYNCNRQFMNDELIVPISDILGEYFRGGPSRRCYEEFYDAKSLATDLKQVFVGYPKGKAPATRGPKKNLVWISDRRMKVDVPAVEGRE